MVHPNNEMLERIPGIVRLRSTPKEHGRIDSDFVLEETWLTKCEAAFFYGVAHLLKHLAREKAAELLDEKEWASCQDTASKRRALACTLGWADEFFWLSTWRGWGTLRDRPKLDRMSAHERFFLALITAEWGDLIREAYYVLKNGLVDLEPSLGDVSSERAEQFGMWVPEDDLEDDLLSRAEGRLNYAEEILRRVKPRKDSGAEVRSELAVAIEDTWWLVCMGQGRVCYAQGDSDKAKGAFSSAIRKARDEKKAGLAQELLDRARAEEATDLNRTSAHLIPDTNPSPIAVRILASWIEDLLRGPADEARHPRMSLEKDHEHSGEDVTQFPDLSTIRRLQRLLGEHLDWLRFVTNDGEDGRDCNGEEDTDRRSYVQRIEDIEKEDKRLNREAFAAPPDAPPDWARWRFYFLRDWGSHTPLFRNNDGSANGMLRGGGGGCFLRYGDLGVVIDPGFNFIERFAEAGLCLREITHVIVTHDHYDHAASFGPLLNLLLKDRDSEKKERDGEKGKKYSEVHFLLCRGVFDQYARSIVDYGYYGSVEPLTDQDVEYGHAHILSKDPEVKVHTTHTEHGNRDGLGKGVGLVFTFKEGPPTIGITSDTGWFEGYKMNGEKKAEESLANVFAEHKPEVMILHVGSLKRRELLDSTYYKTHLGARGVFLTIQNLLSGDSDTKKCRLALLTEFGEECRGHRMWFAKRIDDHFGANGGTDSRPARAGFRCFPTDHRTVVVGEREQEQLHIGQWLPEMPGTPATRIDTVPYLEAKVAKKRDGTYRFKRRDQKSRRTSGSEGVAKETRGSV